MTTQGAATWQELDVQHPDYDHDIIRGLGIIDDICSFLFQPHAPRHTHMRINHQAVMAITSTHFCPWLTSNIRKNLLWFRRIHILHHELTNTLFSSQHIRHQAMQTHTQTPEAMPIQLVTTNMPPPEAPQTGEPHINFDYDILRGLGLTDHICSYLYDDQRIGQEALYVDQYLQTNAAPRQSSVRRTFEQMRDEVKDNHRTLFTFTSTHYYVARTSEARHALLSYRRSHRRALLTLRRHAHLLSDRPTFRWAYLKHGWLVWPTLTTSLIALTRIDICTHLFTYMHAHEILMFTGMAVFLPDHPVRQEIRNRMRRGLPP